MRDYFRISKCNYIPLVSIHHDATVKITNNFDATNSILRASRITMKNSICKPSVSLSLLLMFSQELGLPRSNFSATCRSVNKITSSIA